MKWADPKVVKKAAEEWTDGQIECRIYAHNWNPLTVHHHSPRRGVGGYYIVRQRCPRCRNERTMVMDENGYTNGWQMHYKEGYRLQNLGRVGTEGRAVLRIASIRHTTVIEVKEDE